MLNVNEGEIIEGNLYYSLNFTEVHAFNFFGIPIIIPFFGEIFFDEHPSEPIQIQYPDNIPPSLSIIYPTDEFNVSGIIQIIAEVVETGSLLSQVELQINNGLWEQMENPNETSYIYLLDTAKLANGYSTITIRASDIFGNNVTRSISISVNSIPQPNGYPEIENQLIVLLLIIIVIVITTIIITIIYNRYNRNRPTEKTNKKHKPKIKFLILYIIGCVISDIVLFSFLNIEILTLIGIEVAILLGLPKLVEWLKG